MFVFEKNPNSKGVAYYYRWMKSIAERVITSVFWRVFLVGIVRQFFKKFDFPINRAKTKGKSI